MKLETKAAIETWFGPKGSKNPLSSQYNIQQIFERNHSDSYWVERGQWNASIDTISGIDSISSAVFEKQLTILKEQIENKDVLELCVGTGRVMENLHEYATSYQGIERSSTLHKLIKSHLIKNVQVADVANTFSYEASSFDVVFFVISMSSIYAHIDNVINESFRCLRDGGKVIIVENYAAMIINKYSEIIEIKQ